MDMEYHDLFPTVVGVSNIGRSFKKEEINTIHGLEFIQNIGNSLSTNTNVLDIQALSEIKKFCLESIAIYVKQIINPKNDLLIKITQSWINVTDKNQSHHRHNHPNSFISGSFYIETDDRDKITFYNPKQPIYEIESEEFTPYNSGQWWMPSKTGNLLLFPSTLEHSVETKKHEGYRVSLSFNTQLIGTIGSKQKLTELILRG